jgi:hypothetical protein
VNTQGWALPSTNPPVLKAGIDFSNSQAKAKLLANLRTFDVEANLTYLARSNLSVGTNLILGHRFTNLEKYDFGFTWEPTTGCFLGLKHDSTNKEKIQLGKFFLYF